MKIKPNKRYIENYNILQDVISNLRSTLKYQLKLQQNRQETSVQPFERQLHQLH